MKLKAKILLIVSFLLISFSVPRVAHAANLTSVLNSATTVVTNIQEKIEYFLAFKIENKVQVLEKHADKRLTLAQSYINKKDDQKLQKVIQSYLQIKNKQNDLLRKTNNEEILGAVENKTIEQQKSLEEIKTKINELGKQNVVKIQEQVVNQVANKVVEVKGSEGKTEFFEKVEHVWAPGTGPGGEAGVVYEGGEKLIFAPGTSSGSENATSDIKTVEIKTGGTVNDPVPVQDGPNYAPGTSGDSPGNTSTGETANPGTDGSKTWIDP